MDVQDPSRQTWGRQIEFLFVVVGQGVGFGNVWRFPYICYKNGGGVFFIPYVTAIFLLGIPGAFLEGSLGQFTSRGVISCFKIVPLFQGVGHMIAMLGYLTMCYYSVLFAWVLYYLFASMQSELPWSHCNNTWNTQACRVITATKDNQTWGPSTTVGRNISETGNRTFMDPATEFWERGVLALSSGVDHPGNVKWDLALCLLLAWTLIYFCIWKGVRWIGKISYVTATLPYLLLLTLLVYGVTLEGSANGIKFYLLPDWSKLAEPKEYFTYTTAVSMMVGGNWSEPVENPRPSTGCWETFPCTAGEEASIWLDACIQVFFSYAIGIAIHTSLGSNNVFRTNILKHYFLFAIINSGTSFLCGFVIFSVLGFMAKSQGLSIDEVAESGPGLAFIVYPQAISQMPVPQLWAVLFFLMLAFIAIDSEFAAIDAVIVSIQDLFPPRYRSSPYKEMFAAVTCLSCYLIGLCMVTKGGVYVEQIFEWYCGGKLMFIAVFLECVVIAYGYGSSRFQRNLEYMLGYRIGPFFKYVWLFVTPAICLILLVTDIVLYPIQTYKMKSGIYRYPPGTKAVGWGLVFCSVVWVPAVAVWRLSTTKGALMQRFRQLLRPEFTTTQQQRDRGVHGKDLGEPECLALNTKSENQ